MAAQVERFGIRHHGPGSARSLLTALDELRPDAVLVELPADAGPLLDWVGRGLVPPVALLGHVADRPDVAAFFPVAGFSPEWHALRWAIEREVTVEAIDLPLKHLLAPPSDGDAELPGLDESEDESRSDEPGDASSDVMGERIVDPIGALAAAAGDSDPERWWEDVIEHRGDGTPAFAAVAEAMAELRGAGAPPSDPLEARREAHMRRSVRAASKAGHERIAVVCGAWHVPALDLSPYTASADAAVLRKLPRTKITMSWIPWTYGRLTTATGYRAGVSSPGWYAHVFAHPGSEAVTQFLVGAARELRADGLDASPDHLIAAARLTSALASLRDRPRPGLTEVLDAADSVFSDRRGARLPGGQVIRQRLVVGQAIGEVPERAPQVPLARDVAAQQRRLRLKPTAESRTVELDLRTPTGRGRSHLLHRLGILGVRWGTLTEGRGSSGTFRETWELDWEPEEAVRLVELAHYGTTLVSAATARCHERAREATRLPDLVGVVEQALLADLREAVDPTVAELARRAAHDPDVGELMDALRPLATTLRYGDVRATDATALRRVFDGLVARVMATATSAFGSLDDDAAVVAADRVAAVQAGLALVDHPERTERWPRVLARLATPPGHGLVHGRATRVLHDSGVWSADEVRRRLSRALSAGTPATHGAMFVEGFVAGSGTVLIHDADLRGVIDDWLTSLDGDSFDAVVPLLRRTFGGFEPAERRQLGQLLAAGDQQQTHVEAGEYDPDRLAATADVVGVLLGLDRSVGG